MKIRRPWVAPASGAMNVASSTMPPRVSARSCVVARSSAAATLVSCSAAVFRAGGFGWLGRIGDWRVQIVDIPKSLVDDPNDNAPAIGRVRFPADDARPLQSIEHSGDGAAGQPSQLGQAGRGERILAGGELQALEIGRVDAEPHGRRLVEDEAQRQHPANGRALRVDDLTRSAPLLILLSILASKRLRRGNECERF